MSLKIEPPPGESGDPNVLMGLKTIAAYLGKSVRSVQRWERDLGLPTHRIETPNGQIAYAKRSEIDAWLVTRDRPAVTSLGASPGVVSVPVARSSWMWRWFAALATLAVLLSVTAWLLWGRSKTLPTVFVLTGRHLEARDALGNVLWVHPFDTEVRRVTNGFGVPEASPGSHSAARVDLNRDGAWATLVPVGFGPPVGPPKSDALYAFSDDGRVLWSVTAAQTFSCGGKVISSPWQIRALAVSDDHGPRRVWVSYVHNTLWPSFVVEVSADGHQTLRYLQAGWVTSLLEVSTPSGLRLVAGGVMNPHDRASLVMFDPDGPPVMSPDADFAHSCLGAPTASPDRVILFPNFDLSQADGGPYSMVDRLRSMGSDVRAELDSGLELAFIAPDGTVKDLFCSEAYWPRHRALEALGKLTHSADVCPERSNPGKIMSWTPAGSWQSYTVARAYPAGTLKR